MYVSVSCLVGRFHSKCFSKYRFWNENKDNYGLDDFHDDYESFYYPSAEAWHYQESGSVDGGMTWGNISTYAGGGFIAKLDLNQQITLNIVKELQTYNWVDRYTRAVFIEFPVYNANVNLFTFILLLAEFPVTGGIIHHIDIQVLKVYTFDITMMYYTVCGFALVVYCIGYILIVSHGIIKQKQCYFKMVEHWFNIFIIFDILFIGVAFFLRRFELQTILIKMQKDINQYIQFRLIMTFDGTYKYAIAFLNVLVILKGVFLLQLNLRISKLFFTLKTFIGPLTSFCTIILVMLLAFGSLFHLWYKNNIAIFSSVMWTIETLLNFALGSFDHLQTMTQLSPIATPVIFLGYTFFVNIFLIDLLITLIMDAHYQVEGHIQKLQKEHETSEYILQMILNKILRSNEKI